MSELSVKKSTQFHINELTLVTKAGPIDIQKIFEELNIYDSMFLPVISGNIIIRDSIGLSGKLLFDGSESILIDISKTDSEYNELFLDATAGNVYFFKFDLNAKGVVSYQLNDPKKATKKAALRSKQGVERRSSSGVLKLDKLGFQP